MQSTNSQLFKGTPLDPAQYHVILEVSFECENCEADTPVADARRVGPMWVCRGCYEVAEEDGILEDFAD